MRGRIHGLLLLLFLAACSGAPPDDAPPGPDPGVVAPGESPSDPAAPPIGEFTPVDSPVRVIFPTVVTPVSRYEPFVFRWHHPGLEGPMTYTVKVFNQTMIAMWQSEKLRVPELTAPPELRGKLYPGEGFWWRVMAKPDDGKRLKSNWSLIVVKNEPLRPVTDAPPGESPG